MFIEQPSKWLRWMYPKALWRMNPEEKAVYLTFDDGPIPEATPFILDTLKHYGIKATFFMVGDNVRKYPELHQRVVDEGHRVGNHGWLAPFRPRIQLQCRKGQRLPAYQSGTSASWMDASRPVCLALAQIQDCHVGPRYTRLFQMDDG